MNLCLLSASEIISKIKKKEISSTEVAKSFIDQIHKLEKNVKAWTFFDEDLFLKKAKDSDNKLSSGKSLGPLHGLPVAIKDIFQTEDMPTLNGISIRENETNRHDSSVVDLLKKAGAIVMGKTVTTELAYYDAGKTTNPHDYSRTPGGSSSGSAAAVASFMAPVAVGSQTNGSTIRPASYCGVAAYKPTYGLISRHGCLQQSFLLDHVGLFANNVEDLALCSSVVIKKDNQDRTTVDYKANDLLDGTKSIKNLNPKFAFIKTSRWNNLDKEIQKLFENFIKENQKNITVYETPQFLDKIFDYQKIIQETDMAHNYFSIYDKHRDKIGKKLIEAIERGLKYKAKDYVEAEENIHLLYQSFKEEIKNFDGVVTPSTTGAAPKDLAFTGDPEFCTIWTYLGTPSISLPLLQDSNRMPIGVQFIGNKFEDDMLLKNANWFFQKSKIK